MASIKNCLLPGCCSNSSPIGGDNVTVNQRSKCQRKHELNEEEEEVKTILLFGRLARMCLQICDKCEVNQISNTLCTMITITCIQWRNIGFFWTWTKRRQGLLLFLLVLLLLQLAPVLANLANTAVFALSITDVDSLLRGGLPQQQGNSLASCKLKQLT